MIHLDTETRSRLNIKKTNPYAYAQDRDFAILMMAYAQHDEPVQLTTDGAEISSLMEMWIDEGETFVAHNAMFDRVVLSVHLGLDSYLDPARWIDPAVWAVEAGYPRALEMLAKKLKVDEKDTAGTALINWFCKPQKDGTYRQPEDHQEKWQQFCDYCVTDVDVMRQCLRLLPAPTQSERGLWVAAELINDRGLPVDLDLARIAVTAGEENTARSKERVAGLLGIENPNSVPQMTKGLAEAGLKVPNLRAETVERLLTTDLTDVQRESLELRQELALSAAKKFQAAVVGACDDDRIRGSFKFFGASTGRWSGSGAQPQNLPRATLTAPLDEVVDHALETGVSVKDAQVELDIYTTTQAINHLMSSGESDPYTLKALIRPMFLGPMTVCDYSSIEARVLAWLAGETWALEAFRAGRDIYVETATRMGPGFTRQEGKAATLGLGFNGSVKALRKVGMDGSDEELMPLVVTWRKTNARIVNYWSHLYDAWVYGGVAGRVSVTKSTGVRKMHLPSGRSVVYRGVRWEKYVVENPETKKKEHKEGWRYDRPSGGRVRLWPGLAIENCVQAVARDLLANALIELDREGLPVIGHVHDEVLVEGEHSVEQVSEIMCRTPSWATGLPVDADGFTCARYRKG